MARMAGRVCSVGGCRQARCFSENRARNRRANGSVSLVRTCRRVEMVLSSAMVDDFGGMTGRGEDEWATEMRCRSSKYCTVDFIILSGRLIRNFRWGGGGPSIVLRAYKLLTTNYQPFIFIFIFIQLYIRFLLLIFSPCSQSPDMLILRNTALLCSRQEIVVHPIRVLTVSLSRSFVFTSTHPIGSPGISLGLSLEVRCHLAISPGKSHPVPDQSIRRQSAFLDDERLT